MDIQALKDEFLDICKKNTIKRDGKVYYTFLDNVVLIKNR